MTSDEIKAASGDITLWLKEIAYQLAVSNEQNADPEIQDDYRAVYKEMVERGTQLEAEKLLNPAGFTHPYTSNQHGACKICGKESHDHG